MGGKRVQYLSDLARHGALIQVACRRCGKSAWFEPTHVRELVGGDAEPWTVRFRCSKCGSRSTRVFAKLPERSQWPVK
mgnify:CR=1 FL=1